MMLSLKPVGDSMNAIDALKKFQFFESMEEQELRLLSEHLQRERFTAGQRIVEENMAGKGLYLIVEGEVRVIKERPETEPLILAVLRPGDFFGEMSLFDGGPHSAPVVAGCDTEFLTLGRDDFLKLMETDPIASLKITVRVVKVLSFRLRTANEKLLASAPKDSKPLFGYFSEYDESAGI
jgi:CRP/FNR family cyclic AMP-dependent transcriptional regulator